MSNHHQAMLTGARPPVVTFFLARVLSWVGIVSACALPVAVVTWPKFARTERCGEALGALVWAVVMVIVGERLRWPSRVDARSLRDALQIVTRDRWTSQEADRRSQMLRSGGLVTAVGYAGLAIFAGPLGLFLWFGPALWIGSHVPLLSRSGDDFWNALWWTFVCGAQTAIAAWLCGHGLRVVRRAFSRRFGSR